MSDILLDTSAYAAFHAGHPGVGEAVRRAARVFVNAVVLGELRAGFRRGTHRARNEAYLRTFLSAPRVGILAVDDETAERYAAILDALRKAGTPIPTNDLWIAASAMQCGLVVVTTDAHFRGIPQILVQHFNP
jgi:predicted nucleic acid-binding protein